MLTFNLHGMATHSYRPLRSLQLSLSSRGQYVPLSQVILQCVENAELLFRLKHQQLLQQLARVRAPARQRLKILSTAEIIQSARITSLKNDIMPPQPASLQLSTHRMKLAM